MNRRDAMIRLGQFGLGALTLPDLVRADSLSAAAARKVGKLRAKSCIYLFLWGGPPQQDMWDLKPNAPSGVRSHFQPIATRAPGVQIADQLPLTAAVADKFAILRSLTHPSNVHETSVYHMLTGRVDNTLVAPRNHRKRSDFPNVGSVVSRFSPMGEMPAAVTIPRPIGHDGITYSGTHAGFLGPRHDPMEPREAPNSTSRPAHSLELPDGLATDRLLARQGLLESLERVDEALQTSRGAEGLSAYRAQALSMLSSPRAQRAFRLDTEPDRLRDRYGRNEYGESFLLARRLVEAGVRLVTVVWMYFMPNGRISNVWDNHGGTPGLGSITGYAMLKEKYCLPPLDQAFSALIDDLSVRGLLDETLVVMAGEFGRTPKINAAQGRDHWGPLQSVVLAGAGVKGGQVIGSSDRDAAYPRDNPVTPEDLMATIYDAFGLPAHAEIADRQGRPQAISTGRSIADLLI